MEVVHVVSCCIIFLLTVTASPEIPSKGKHMHMGDKSHTSLEDGDFPRFAEPVANVTVSVGRDALLACVVENLKGYKVAWVRVDTQTILSIHHNVISQNNRISLTYNDHRSWYLHIKEVEESDRGWYMCQVNTDPMRSRKGYLQVVVPPMIVEGMTSNDLVVREGLNVTLMCKARGYPEPYVMWRREDGEEMLIGGEHVNVVDGELLHITKVSRLHMAAYLCVASNGVPPSISKRVHLRVQFPPMLSIPNQLEGAYVGQDVILECHTEAYPASINYWTTERGDMIISDTSRAGDKYETTSTVNGYTKYMKLKIRNVGPNDFGTYRCVAKNSLGETDGNIKLDEMPAPTTAILSEMAMLNRSLGTMFSRKNGKRRNKNKLDSNSLPDYGVEEWRDGAGNAGDNNQAPMRNPPDAFHNSAGALAQHNLVGIIIQAIKMQSLGIFKRLTNFVQAINDNEILENIEVAVVTILKTTILGEDVHKMRKYFFATSQAMLKKWIKSTVSKWRQQWRQHEQQQQLPQLGYKTSAKTRKLCKNLIKENQDENEDENEYKTFKHFSTQETHVSRCDNKHGNIQNRKLSTSSHHLFQTNNQTKKFLKHARKGNGGNRNANISPANRNFFIEHFYVSSRFENHIKQQEILYKFNNLYVTANKFKPNTPPNSPDCSCYSGRSSLKLFANFIYWLIILPLSIFALTLIVNLLPTTVVKRFKRIRFHSCYTHNLMLKWLKANVNNIWWHIVYMANNMVKILTSVYTKFSLNLNSTQASTTLQRTTSAAKTAAKAAARASILTKTPSPLSSSLSTQSLVTTTTTTIKTSSSSCSPTLSSLSSSSSSSSSSSLSSSQVTASALPCSTLLFCR